jgi:hypothetical protein
MGVCRALEFFTGALAAQYDCKPLKTLAPLQNLSGAANEKALTIWHKKTPDFRGFCKNAPLMPAEVLRTLTTSGALVNTHSRASKMSVGSGRHTRSLRRCAKRHSRVATPRWGATRERRNACV